MTVVGFRGQRMASYCASASHKLGGSGKLTVKSVVCKIGSRTATDGRRDNQPARRCRLGCGGLMPARNGGRSSCYWGDMEATVSASAMPVYSSSWLLSLQRSERAAGAQSTQFWWILIQNSTNSYSRIFGGLLLKSDILVCGMVISLPLLNYVVLEIQESLRVCTSSAKLPGLSK